MRELIVITSWIDDGSGGNTPLLPTPVISMRTEDITGTPSVFFVDEDDNLYTSDFFTFNGEDYFVMAENGDFIPVTVVYNIPNDPNAVLLRVICDDATRDLFDPADIQTDEEYPDA